MADHSQTPARPDGVVYDLVIRGGRVIDPETGLDSVRDVGIIGDRIVSVSEEPLSGRRQLEASGHVVAPGFIDLHSHSQAVAESRLQALDGVTTALELEAGVAPVGVAYERAALEGRHRDAIRLTVAGGFGGVLFIVFKTYEWGAKISAGHTNSEMFYSFYYVLTGVHLVHVLIGLIVLGVVVRELRNPARRRVSMVESGAIYWHMVDLLWVIIFGLLYVMR